MKKSLKLIRQFYRLTQTELAEKLNVSKSQISEIESGRKNASPKMIEKYSEAFGIPTSSIHFLNEQLENRDTNNLPSISKTIVDILKWITSDDDLNGGRTKENGKHTSSPGIHTI